MSADNYIFVAKTETGKYSVSMRFASSYYEDEITEPPREYHTLMGDERGWSVDNGLSFHKTMEDAIQSSPQRPDWVEPAPDGVEFDKPIDAILHAHKRYSEEYIVEYGVVVAKTILLSLSNAVI